MVVLGDAGVARDLQIRVTPRREDARASCELLYFRHSVFLKERFAKDELVAFIQKYMGDERTADYIEERASQLRQLIEQKLDDKSRRVEERLRQEEELKREGERIGDDRRRLANERAALEKEKQRIDEQGRRLDQEEADRKARPMDRDIDPGNV